MGTKNPSHWPFYPDVLNFWTFAPKICYTKWGLTVCIKLKIVKYFGSLQTSLKSDIHTKS